MTKSFRYLIYSFSPYYPALLAVALGLTAACALTGAGTGKTAGLASLCVLYFNLFPGFLLTVLLLAGLAFTTTNLNHALSYGGRRTDYWRALLCFTLCNTLLLWAAEVLFACIPAALGWSNARGFYPPSLSPMFPALLLAVFSLGCALGPIATRNRWVGGLIGGMCGGAMAGYFTHASLAGRSVWDGFSQLPFLACLLVTLVCQLKIRSTVMNASVR